MLEDNTSGSNNTGVGSNALDSNTEGADNTAIGVGAGRNITTGDRNIIIGSQIDVPSATANGQISIGNLIFGTNATATGTTVSSGAVGIGTAAPFSTFTLHVRGPPGGIALENTDAATTSTGFAFYQSAMPTAADQRLGYFLFGTNNGGTARHGAMLSAYTEAAWSGSSLGTSLRFETTPVGSTTRAERLRVTGSGDVGIGTTVPGSKLDVRGATTIVSTSATALVVGANGTTNPVLKVDAATGSVATGIGITGAAAAGRAALAVISSGTDEGLSVDAKGAGTIRLGATSTGAVEFSRNAVPTSSDGAALGTSSLMWSDLFLASGAVINFNNGDVTATHAANALAFAGASSGYTFDAGVGIGTTSVAASALLDMVSTAQGFLPPRMTEAQRDGIGTPATGLVVFNTTAAQLQFYDGDSWEAVGAGAGGAIAIDDLTDATTDCTANNMFLGQGGGAAITTGTENTALGESALAANTEDDGNTALGYSALESLVDGFGNTAVGLYAMTNNAGSHHNTAVGAQAMADAGGEGSFNTAIGSQTLRTNDTGGHNVAVGYTALESNIEGNQNTAMGAGALAAAEDGFENTAIGFAAMVDSAGGQIRPSAPGRWAMPPAAVSTPLSAAARLAP